MTSHGESKGEREWPWSALQIDATDDVKRIKSAYAKILKRDKANSDAEAFQNLKSARDLAVDIAEGRVVPEAIDLADLTEHSEGDPEDQGEVLEDIVTVFKEADQTDQSGEEVLGPDLQEQLNRFLESSEARHDVSAWTKFLASMPLLSREQGMFFEGRVAFTVDDWFDGVKNFPTVDVLNHLFKHFQWSGIESQLPNLIGELRVRRIKTYIRSFEILMER